MTEYRYVGSYATALRSGRPVGPGETMELTDEEVNANGAMIEDGLLLEVQPTKSSRQKKSAGEEE